MKAEEMRKIAMNSYNKEYLEKVIEAIKVAAANGSCTLNTNQPNGDTLCHILRGDDYGFECTATLFSDGWHCNIRW